MTPAFRNQSWLAPVVALAVALGVGACREPVQKEVTPQPVVEGDAVIFPKGSPQIESLVTEPVKRRGDGKLVINGRLAWDEDRTVRVVSPFAGRVTDIRVRAGDAVRPGQALATVTSPEVGQAQAEARRAEFDAALARKNLDRLTELHTAGVAPLKDLQSATADRDRAEAERVRTAERLRLYRASGDAIDQQLVIRAPIAGVVVERNLNPGQELRPDQPPPNGLLVISDPTRLWFVLDVSERDIGAFAPGTKVELRPAAQPEVMATGTVTHVSDAVDPTTRTVKVRGLCPNADRRLKSEMFMVASVTTSGGGGLVVPTKAVYLQGEGSFVFAAAGDGRYVRRAVRLGPGVNGTQVVFDGVAEDDRVVVDGNLLLERIHAAKRPTTAPKR